MLSDCIRWQPDGCKAAEDLMWTKVSRRYAGVGPPPQDDDFIKVAGTEVRTLLPACVSSLARLDCQLAPHGGLCVCVNLMQIQLSPALRINPVCGQCTQFELSCRPWYPAGFNAHHLVSNVLVFAHEHKTPGKASHLALATLPSCIAAHRPVTCALTASKHTLLRMLCCKPCGQFGPSAQ